MASLAFLTPNALRAAPDRTRDALVAAVLAPSEQQPAAILALPGDNAELVTATLKAWQQGGIYLHTTETGDPIPFTLDPAANPSGASAGTSLATGEPLIGPDGQPLRFTAASLTAVETTSKIRQAIKVCLDLLGLGHSDPEVRRNAANKLAGAQRADYRDAFAARLAAETHPAVRTALEDAIAYADAKNAATEPRIAAIEALGDRAVIRSKDFLTKLSADSAVEPAVREAARRSVVQLDSYMFRRDLIGTAFRGLSLGSVMLVVAMGLAITFGLMGIINMAHGEMIVVGAYATYVVQNWFIKAFGSDSAGFEFYFLVALPAAFLSAACAGLILERSIVRFLYKRPLESMLATWGVSLIMQQGFRLYFGANNVQLISPRWLSGNVTAWDVIFAYNRLFVIGLALGIVLLTWLVLNKTSLGLLVRAVMQNRSMAACMGVRTDRVNMLTFAFGSGLAGLAGAFLAQLGNVGPSLGQTYIVDCFMVVVVGGVGNLMGTVLAAFGIGTIDQVLQPFLGAVLGKVCVLCAIILFLQWRPEGLFATRSRALD